jgi:hypothetical protein
VSQGRIVHKLTPGFELGDPIRRERVSLFEVDIGPVIVHQPLSAQVAPPPMIQNPSPSERTRQLPPTTIPPPQMIHGSPRWPQDRSLNALNV